MCEGGAVEVLLEPSLMAGTAGANRAQPLGSKHDQITRSPSTSFTYGAPLGLCADITAGNPSGNSRCLLPLHAHARSGACTPRRKLNGAATKLHWRKFVSIHERASPLTLACSTLATPASGKAARVSAMNSRSGHSRTIAHTDNRDDLLTARVSRAGAARRAPAVGRRSAARGAVLRSAMALVQHAEA